jgi:hypothetical protein
VVLAALPYPLFRSGAARSYQGAGRRAHRLRGGDLWPGARPRNSRSRPPMPCWLSFSPSPSYQPFLRRTYWLAFRAFGLSLSGALVFWSARTVAPSSREGPWCARWPPRWRSPPGRRCCRPTALSCRLMARAARPGGKPSATATSWRTSSRWGLTVLALAGLEARRRWEGFLWQAGVALGRRGAGAFPFAGGLACVHDRVWPRSPSRGCGQAAFGRTRSPAVA